MVLFKLQSIQNHFYETSCLCIPKSSYSYPQTLLFSLYNESFWFTVGLCTNSHFLGCSFILVSWLNENLFQTLMCHISCPFYTIFISNAFGFLTEIQFIFSKDSLNVSRDIKLNNSISSIFLLEVFFAEFFLSWTMPVPSCTAAFDDNYIFDHFLETLRVFLKVRFLKFRVPQLLLVGSYTWQYSLSSYWFCWKFSPCFHDGVIRCKNFHYM